MTVLTMAELEELRRRFQASSLELQATGMRLVADVRRFAGPFANLLNIEPACRYIENFLDWLRREFTSPPALGVPWTLWNHGNTWAGDAIQGRLSRQVGRLTRDGLLTDDYWQGRSADAYNFALPRQSEAIDSLAARCRAIDDVLTKMCIAVSALWLAVISLLVSLVVEYFVQAAAASTGIGAPAAAGGAAASTAKFLALLAAVTGSFYAFVMTEALPEIKDLRQDLHNDAKFPNGAWPRPSQTIFTDPEWRTR